MSPHPGTLEVYEDAGGGPTVDPAVAYYSVDAEPIENVYETLIGLNGSSTSELPAGFTPQAATCVPGSNTCNAQFGSTLVYNNLTTGAPQYYTFEIDSGAHFYDPGTGVSWPVYPSDVLFSFARTIAWANQPGVGVYNGWINAQDILPSGNASWDGAIHAPYNNTPENFYAGILVNDSAYCPTSTIVSTNGCVTFNVGPSGLAWPYFLELVADNLGGSIVPCGVFTAVGAGVPGFLGSSAPNGDGPCLLPGNATSSTSAAFQTYLSTLTPTAWDSFEDLGSTNYPYPQASVSQYMVGSGPYAATSVSVSEGYFLEANPAYQQPVGCAGQSGCLPAPGAYIPNVDVYWNNGDATGLAEMAAHVADTAEFTPNNASSALASIESGDYSLVENITSFTVLDTQFDLDFSPSSVEAIDATGRLNVSGTFFDSIALREFLVNAYPYQTINSEEYTVDGIPTGEPYGGAIPRGMGDSYPDNVSWPGGNPDPNASILGNVAWWWHVLTTPGTEWYNSTDAACSSKQPCRWPIILTGFSGEQGEYLYAQEIQNLTADALQPYVIVAITTCGYPCCLALPGCPGWQTMTLGGWAPDYADPSDYDIPFYSPYSAYTYGNSLHDLEAPPQNSTNTTLCPDNYASFDNLTYYADLGELPNACQSNAYQTLLYWMDVANRNLDNRQRNLEFALVEAIADELALYVYNPQELNSVDCADWIVPSSINTNPMVGGSGDQLWYNWVERRSAQLNVTESGLTPNLNWTVEVASGGAEPTANASSVGPSLTFELPLGNYTLLPDPVAGYRTPDPVEVSLVGNLSVLIDYLPLYVSNNLTLFVSESGLPAGLPWTASVSYADATGEANVTSAAPSIAFSLPEGTVIVNVTGPSSWVATPPTQTVNLTQNRTALVAFSPVVPSTYLVSFVPFGLPAGGSWALSVGGRSYSGSGTFDAELSNGSWTWGVITTPSGYSVVPGAGVINVTGAPTTVNLTFYIPVCACGSSSGPSPTYLSPLAWQLISLLGVLLLAAVAVAVYTRLRKPPPSTPGAPTPPPAP